MSKKFPVSNASMIELKRMIKNEKNNPANRLSSLHLRQDLNLGGTKPKKFLPNINIARAVSSERKFAPSLNDNQNRRRQNENRNKNDTRRGNKRPGNHANKEPSKYAKVEGIFSEGLGRLERTTNHTTSRSYSGRQSKNAPVISFSHEFDAADTSSFINKVFYVDSDYEDDGELQAVDDIDPQIKQEAIRTETLVENLSSMKKIKTDDLLDYISDVNYDQPSETNSSFSDTNKNTCCFNNNLKYTEEDPSYSLIKFPESLVGFACDEKGNNFCNLRDLPSGQIGKIIVRKSGKMEMVFNDFRANLNVVNEKYNQETVITVPGKESISIEPSVVELGRISDTFMVTPVWNSLFDKMNKKNV